MLLLLLLLFFSPFPFFFKKKKQQPPLQIAVDKNPASKPIDLDSDLDSGGSIESRLGERSHSDALFDRAKTVILSPGVPFSQAHVARLLASSPEKVVSEMSFAAQGLPKGFPVAAITGGLCECEDSARMCRQSRFEALVVAIAIVIVIVIVVRPLPACLSGTNGKSTVTTFVQQLLIHAFSPEQDQARGGRVFAGGNLGSTLSELVLSIAKGEQWDAAAIECSR